MCHSPLNPAYRFSRMRIRATREHKSETARMMYDIKPIYNESLYSPKYFCGNIITA